MKKPLLFLLLLCFTLISVSHAQQIELIGKGVNGKSSETLSISDWSTVTQVNAFATSKGFYSIPPDDGVLFDNGQNSESEWNQISGPENLSAGSDESVGVYTRSFSSLSSSSINAVIKEGAENKIHSFYLFVQKDILVSDYISYSDFTPVFMFHNGSSDPYVYEIDIDPVSNSRDLTVKIPVSELDDGERNMIINIRSDDGSVNKTFSETTYNQGNSLLLLEYKFENVAGSIKQMKVSVYSPDPSEDGDNGDSFFVGGVVIDAEKVGCTLTQGYWKTHSICKPGNGKGPKRDDTWDLVGDLAESTQFFISGKDYCGVYDTKPGKGGKYYILAHQYIAAQLNLLSNANPTDVAEAFEEATKFLEMYTPGQVDGNRSLEAKAVELGGILDDFNNGRIGPGHCDDNDNDHDDDEVYIQPIKQERNKALFYPNPASDKGKLAFESKQTGMSSVELFNVHGQKMGTLFSGKLKKGDQIEIEYDASKLPKGIYFAIIKNGTDLYKEKVSIVN